MATIFKSTCNLEGLDVVQGTGLADLRRAQAQAVQSQRAGWLTSRPSLRMWRRIFFTPEAAASSIMTYAAQGHTRQHCGAARGQAGRHRGPHGLAHCHRTTIPPDGGLSEWAHRHCTHQGMGGRNVVSPGAEHRSSLPSHRQSASSTYTGHAVIPFIATLCVHATSGASDRKPYNGDG